MASEIEFIIDTNRGVVEEIAASTVLHDLYLDYLHFHSKFNELDPKLNAAERRRMARASLLVYFSYVDGVTNRWVQRIDPDFDLKKSRFDKMKRLRAEVDRRRGRTSNQMPPERARALRNAIVHLSLHDHDKRINDDLVEGAFFHDLDKIQNWLRAVGRHIKLTMHDEPREIVAPFLGALAGPIPLVSSKLSEEDEELVRIAEVMFLDLDAREAADEHP